MKKGIIALLLSLCMVMPLVGCGGSGAEKKEGTINIMMVESGYGTKWIEDVKDKFEALYADEGYKVNILPANPNFQGNAALSEIRLGYEKTGYDIVISSGYTVQQLTDSEYPVSVEALTDVMNSKPINFDGSLGDDTIANLTDSSQDWRIKIGDTYWGVPTSSDIRGLVCNMEVLNRYGITEMPVTTDELFEDFDIIYNGLPAKDGKPAVNGRPPITWGGDNAYGYALPLFYNTIAQLMGRDDYEDFFTLDYLLNDDGTIKADGYNHLNNDAVKEAINVTMHSFDVEYSVAGSITQNHTKAHAQVIRGATAFMFDGNFFLNEVRAAFPDYLDDVRFCLTPMPSKLGVDLQLDGTGSDRAKCDDILAYMIRKVDEGKSATEIKSATEAQFSITLTDEKVNRVIDARTIGHGGSSFLNIIKGAKNVEISKLFIRMLLSEDSAKNIYAKYGMVSPTFADADIDNQYQFIKDAYQARQNCDFYTTSQLMPGSVRERTNLFLIPPYKANFVVEFKDTMGTPGSPVGRNYDTLTQSIFDKITANTQSQWATLMEGYTIGQ